MHILFLWVLILNIDGMITSNYRALSDDVLSRIFNMLSKQDIIESVMTLDNRTYCNYYLSEHQQTIKKMKVLESLLMHSDCSHAHCVSAIANITNELKLNELFALRLPSFLNMIVEHHSFPIIHRILSAMNVREISISELNCIDALDLYNDSNTNRKLKLLILSSRALAPIQSIPDLDASEDSEIFLEYPWIDLDPQNALNSNVMGVASIIYFGYIYEFLMDHCHKELHLSHLDSSYHDKNEFSHITKENAMILVETLGFIPWHRDSIHRQRTRAIKSCRICDERKFIELMFLSKTFNLSNRKSDFLSFFIMDLLDDGHINLTHQGMVGMYAADHDEVDSVKSKLSFIGGVIDRLISFNFIKGRTENHDKLERISKILTSPSAFLGAESNQSIKE